MLIWRLQSYYTIAYFIVHNKTVLCLYNKHIVNVLFSRGVQGTFQTTYIPRLQSLNGQHYFSLFSSSFRGSAIKIYSFSVSKEDRKKTSPKIISTCPVGLQYWTSKIAPKRHIAIRLLLATQASSCLIDNSFFVMKSINIITRVSHLGNHVNKSLWS